MTWPTRFATSWMSLFSSTRKGSSREPGFFFRVTDFDEAHGIAERPERNTLDPGRSQEIRRLKDLVPEGDPHAAELRIEPSAGNGIHQLLEDPVRGKFRIFDDTDDALEAFEFFDAFAQAPAGEGTGTPKAFHAGIIR